MQTLTPSASCDLCLLLLQATTDEANNVYQLLSFYCKIKLS